MLHARGPIAIKQQLLRRLGVKRKTFAFLSAVSLMFSVRSLVEGDQNVKRVKPPAKKIYEHRFSGILPGMNISSGSDLIATAISRLHVRMWQSGAISPVRQIPVTGERLLSANFSEPDQIVVQTIDLPNNGSGGQKPPIVRHLAIFGMKEERWIHTVETNDTYESDSTSLAWGRCSRIVYFPGSSTLVVCDGIHTVRVRDAKSLQLRRVLTLNPNIETADFAANDREEVLYTFGVEKDRSIVLATYSLLNGILLSETVLSTNSETPNLSVSLSNDGKALAVAINDPANKKGKGGVSICRRQGTSLTCKTILQKFGVAQVGFRGGSYVLFVSEEFADRRTRGDCLQEMSISTYAVDSHAFCKEDSGVHYAFAPLGVNRVVAFTGYATYNPLTENTHAIANYASVWTIEPKRIVAVTNTFGDWGPVQSFIRIVADGQNENHFMVFQDGVNLINLYDM
jgi:hypothetical protein